MYGVFCYVLRTSNTPNSEWQSFKIGFLQIDPENKTYSLTFLYDEFMMYKGLYSFQLYSLHKQSILMYLEL